MQPFWAWSCLPAWLLPTSFLDLAWQEGLPEGELPQGVGESKPKLAPQSAPGPPGVVPGWPASLTAMQPSPPRLMEGTSWPSYVEGSGQHGLRGGPGRGWGVNTVPLGIVDPAAQPTPPFQQVHNPRGDAAGGRAVVVDVFGGAELMQRGKATYACDSGRHLAPVGIPGVEDACPAWAGGHHATLQDGASSWLSGAGAHAHAPTQGGMAAIEGGWGPSMNGAAVKPSGAGLGQHQYWSSIARPWGSPEQGVGTAVGGGDDREDTAAVGKSNVGANQKRRQASVAGAWFMGLIAVVAHAACCVGAGVSRGAIKAAWEQTEGATLAHLLVPLALQGRCKMACSADDFFSL